MNLLLPLLNHSPNNYYELRFALRSLCIHNPIERCLVVGGKPNWYTGEHLPYKDYKPQLKEQNIRDKVNAGAQYLRLTTTDNNFIRDINEPTEFLFANDDHFVLAPYPGAHNKGLLSDCLKNRHPNGSVSHMLRNTLQYFGDVVNTDTHCPLIMTAEGVERTMFDWPDWGLGFKTAYCAVNKIDSVYHPDTKLNDLTVIPDVPYFSTADGCKNLERLFDLFPNKSIFEN